MIGLSHRQVEGFWAWESGSQLSAEVETHWSLRWGQPDNLGGHENCAMVTKKDDVNPSMHDIPCNLPRGFVCQKRLGE